MTDSLGRQRYDRLVERVSEIVRRHDPIDLIDIGAPDDEYDPEVGTIVPRLKDADGPDALMALIHEEFVRWFTDDLAGPPERYRDLAREVWEAWVEFRGGAA